MKPKSTPRIYYQVLLIVVIVVNFTRIFVMQAFKIPTGSMVDNLLIGDHVIVNKFVYSPGASVLFRSLFLFASADYGSCSL